MSNSHLEYLLAQEIKLTHQLELTKEWIFQERVKAGIHDTPTPSASPLSVHKEGETSKKPIIDYLKLTWNQRFLTVLKEKQRFMKCREIAQYLVGRIVGTEGDITTQLSRRTKKLQDLKKIVKYKATASNLDVFWGSPDWLSNDNEIIKGFEFNESALNSKLSKVEEFEI